uniref:Uncharacterized protein n=2 Tax=Gopherus TaxID=38771 RepID=A0A8C4YG25_9SAUR
ISRTITRIRAVPDRGGEPPSIAMSVKLISSFSSRSRGLSSTSSAYFLLSLRSRV